VEANLLGPIPDSIGNCSNLTNLLLYDGDSKGDTTIFQIPTSLSKLKNLKTMVLALPGLAGSVPSIFENMTSLRHLSLGSAYIRYDIALNNQIPKDICDLSQLEYLDLSHTSIHFVGTFCGDHLPLLRELRLAFMPKLYINFYRLIRNRNALELLDMESTPVTIGESIYEFVPNLQYLNLRNIKHALQLPRDFWNLTQLNYLNLASTMIAGTIETGIGNMKYLSFIDLSRTHISGTIPREIGSCTMLTTIELDDTLISGPLPEELGNLENLQHLIIHGAHNLGELPHNLSKLSNLFQLKISSSGLEGPIPDSYAKLSNLKLLDLSNNKLTHLPDLPQPFISLELHNNLLGPNLSAMIQRRTKHLNVASNSFGPHLSYDDIYLNTDLLTLDLTGNSFVGTLPIFSPLQSGKRKIHMSSNSFFGSIPSSYSNIHDLAIANNLLTGSLDNLFMDNCMSVYIDLRSNQLNGTLPSLSHCSLEELHLGDNRLNGLLPPFPLSLRVLDVSSNAFRADLPSLLNVSKNGALEVLDLSSNYIRSHLPENILTSNLSYLSMANNEIFGRFTQLEDIPTMSSNYRHLLALDLSNNAIQGSFIIPKRGLGSITSLRLSNNSFEGNIDFKAMPLLTVLDLSNNSFTFDCDDFSHLSFLVALDVRQNNIFGSLSLSGMPNLKTADFSSNKLNSLQLKSLSAQFIEHRLQFLSIINNTLERITSRNLQNSFQLLRTNSKSPAPDLRGVQCYSLAFGSGIDKTFLYDTNLFSYFQCDCDDLHYGKPPNQCFECPSTGIEECNVATLTSTPNWFLFPNPDIFTSDTSSTSRYLEIETCLMNTEYEIAGTSNCVGFYLKPFNSSPPRFPNGTAQREEVEKILKNQCRLGSDGRLCSHCICEEEAGQCFFPSGTICKQCSTLLPSSRSIPIAIVLIIIFILILSFIMFLILKSKRTQKDQRWKDLSLVKRIVYRMLHMTRLGNITITVTFLQIIVELTHWDAYALSQWARVINGDAKGIGLRCIFPFLSDPMADLLLRLFLPFMFVLVVALSIGLAEIGHLIQKRLKFRKFKKNAEDDVHIQSEHSEDDLIESFRHSNESFELLMKDEKNEKDFVDYPWTALLSSVSISIIRFFYFGTALAAHEYLFSSTQPVTNEKYVQSQPWMKFDDAARLRGVSIPFMILYDVGLPLVFGLSAWMFRHKISSPLVQNYFGSLFENYDSSLFWWEIVNVVRKLGIALVLRGTHPSSAAQPSLVLLIIIGILIAQTTFRPWKGLLENVFDTTSASLIIASLFATRFAALTHSNTILYILLGIDLVFVLLNAILVAYETITGKTTYQAQWEIRFAGNTNSLHQTPPASFEPPLLQLAINYFDPNDGDQM
jgi:Leucine-rich repeat (LRR) protein